VIRSPGPSQFGFTLGQRYGGTIGKVVE